MRTLLSISALLVTVFLVQTGIGSMGPVAALSAIAYGFSPFEIGLIGAAHFVGFIAGCFLTPYLLFRVSHSRAFSAMAGLAVISVLLHPILNHALAWMILRVFIGFSVAGSYTAIESWLNSKLTQTNRSRFFSVYKLVDMAGGLLSQALIISLIPGTYLSFSIIAIVICLSFLPLALTKSVPPDIEVPTRFRPILAMEISPLAAVGAVIVGATSAAVRMVGPVFGYESNFSSTDIGIFLMLFILGGALAQIPVGLLAEHINKRRLIVMLSALTVVSSISLQFFSGNLAAVANPIFIMIFLFGATTIPLYSLSATHANDLADPDDYTDLSASLILFFGLGAITSPVITSLIIDQFGPNAMFTFFAALHGGMIIFAFYRSRRRPGLPFVSSYMYIPRTTLLITARLRRQRARKNRL